MRKIGVCSPAMREGSGKRFVHHPLACCVTAAFIDFFRELDRFVSVRLLNCFNLSSVVAWIQLLLFDFQAMKPSAVRRWQEIEMRYHLPVRRSRRLNFE
jgi:hypothetical protein